MSKRCSLVYRSAKTQFSSSSSAFIFERNRSLSFLSGIFTPKLSHQRHIQPGWMVRGVRLCE